MWSNALRDCLLLSVLTSIASAGSPPAVQWVRTFAGDGGALGRYAEQTSDGGYIAVGVTVGDSGPRFHVVKTTTAGTVEWETKFGLPAGRMEAVSGLETADGGYVVVGGGRLAQDSPPGVCLLSVNAQGELVWQQVINDSIRGDGYSVVQTEDRGFVVAATTALRATGLLLIKTDSLGVRQWTRRFSVPYRDECSGDIVQLRQTTDKGYVVATKVLLKVDSLGNQQWLRTYSGVNNAYSVVQTSDGGYAATGPASDAQGDIKRRIFLLKTDAQGNELWRVNHAESNFSRGYWLEQISDSGFVISGAIQTDRELGYVLRTDAGGSVIWSDTLSDAADGACIRQAADNGFLVTGTYYENATDNCLMYLLKLAPEH